MKTPSLVRRLRTRLDDARTTRLRAELATANARNRALEQRLAALQDANVGAYHALAIANGQPCAKTGCTLCTAAKAVPA
ncbi:hypothetical protein ACIRJO_02675 [Streptomyces sp. NPDC102394]|uniref:hypothetical protein n=1 Tax=Streptomyces sp. NPDC102394 TaxID=3366167 RepID=UPI0037F528FB